jgi:hypothetical protein
MPSSTERQRKFMGADLQRKREGKETKTDMTEEQLEDFASKGKQRQVVKKARRIGKHQY